MPIGALGSWLGKTAATIAGKAAPYLGPLAYTGAVYGVPRRLGAWEKELSAADESHERLLEQLRKQIKSAQEMKEVPVREVLPDNTIKVSYRPATDEDRKAAAAQVIAEYNSMAQMGAPSQRLGTNPMAGKYFIEGYRSAFTPDEASGKPGGLVGLFGATAGQIPGELQHAMTGRKTLGAVNDVSPEGDIERSRMAELARPATESPIGVQATPANESNRAAEERSAVVAAARRILDDPNSSPEDRVKAWSVLGITYGQVEAGSGGVGAQESRVGVPVQYGPQPWQKYIQVGEGRAPSGEPAMGAIITPNPYGVAGNDAEAYRRLKGVGITKEQFARDKEARRLAAERERERADSARRQEAILRRSEEASRREAELEAAKRDRALADDLMKMGFSNRYAAILQREAAELRSMERTEEQVAAARRKIAELSIDELKGMNPRKRVGAFAKLPQSIRREVVAIMGLDFVSPQS